MFDGYFTNYDPSYDLVFQAEWIDWEENSWVFIFTKDGEYFLIEGGHCVMASDHSTPDWKELDVISEDAALHIMEEWKEYEV